MRVAVLTSTRRYQKMNKRVFLDVLHKTSVSALMGLTVLTGVALVYTSVNLVKSARLEKRKILEKQKLQKQSTEFDPEVLKD